MGLGPEVLGPLFFRLQLSQSQKPLRSWDHISLTLTAPLLPLSNRVT